MYSIGDKIKVTIFGQSHAEAIGAVIDGLPAGIEIDTDKIYEFMQRRAPGRNKYSTPRQEKDFPEIISGLAEGKTCGAPLCAVIRNADTRSGDYENLKAVPRPGHADYTAYVKYGGNNDIRGGGQFSGRMTAPLCFAGALCMQILEQRGITIGAHVMKIHGVRDEAFDSVNVSAEELKSVTAKEFPTISDTCAVKMKEEIEKARSNGNSVGGIAECAVLGVKPGIGGPLFEGIEGEIAKAVFGIPAVKGIEFGAGFGVAEMYGTENNDEFVIKDGAVKTATNNHGGILGGISSGMPIIFRTAIKPTPSVAMPQNSVNLKTETAEELIIKGRHDPCIVQRAVPCIEAAAAIVILNMLGEY